MSELRGKSTPEAEVRALASRRGWQCTVPSWLGQRCTVRINVAGAQLAASRAGANGRAEAFGAILDALTELGAYEPG